ncbi:cholinesterase precursor [Dothidotthia symphoricarpi CBS 119687]|uniref:Carboxylic ester hydrolase n=1 Tax=Dothidotthia symphoricarpi CBS 119687 TaxID=1392245 RepID=A0A6A6ASZ1_9PLEO|nr:cholinesterase precursor [Dothidotthia symphoricarpi CBS 119687]KAF2134298.1 cholinesterase precursor [Dothidotthia symphoricarpi CBS 119687]
MNLLLLTAAAAATLFGPVIAGPVHSYNVLTTSGTIVGHEASNRSSVTEYLGIRYAAAPVDELRFAAPKKFVASKGTVFEASEWVSVPYTLQHSAALTASVGPPVSSFPNFTEPSGLRVWKNFAAQNSNPTSEDCLKLNVWTKNAGNAKAKKPVLVFIHGGRFQIPGPHSPFYNGQYLSDTEDVVVVTFNYRLGIFGFAGAPGVEANAALKDHRAAVEWVRDNIVGFGGDPSRIVIFGQSAGGASVDYWSFAWKKDPIVSGLIPMSGTSLSFLPNTPEYAQTIWYNVSQTVGCGGPNDNSANVLSCVRSKNTSVILAAAAKVPALPSLATLQATFHPTVDNVTVFADYEQLSASGSFAKIPLLAGNNDQEDGWYRLSGWASKLNFTNAQWDLFSQRAFNCPNAYSTKYRVQYGVPTWRYRYHGDFDNVRLYNSTAGLSPRGSGAYHGVDLNSVFGTAEDVSGLENSPAQDATIKYVMGAWGAFATDSKNGLTKYGWPAYSTNGKTLVRLAYNNSAKPDFIEPITYDAVCPAKNDPLPGRGAF